MAIPTLTVTPSAAAEAYRRAEASGAGGGDFGAVLDRAVQGVIDVNKQAETQSMQAIAGGGNITEVVAAVSKAELALQTTVAIRDRVVQAYQDIMKMPI
ncbi:MAG: flagellar hook-basal body complex protein FliE [Rhodospirillales bacterium]|nr:flagellar hook-basal body complex protein FliE [Rhodospirillales bacterium]MDE2574732.1 flagellar hook-basal body complex protein FliE [Rhodospirillales bacterium]